MVLNVQENGFFNFFWLCDVIRNKLLFPVLQ